MTPLPSRLPLVAPMAALLLLATPLASSAAQGGSKAAPQPTYPADTVRADLQELYAMLRRAHYDLYARTPRAEYDARYRESLASVRGPMRHLDVVRLFQAFVAVGKVAHAQIGFPEAAFAAYADSGGTMFPADLRVVGGRTLVAHDYSAEPLLAPGTEVIAIDGVAVGARLARLGRYISADHRYMRDALFEFDFPRLLWLDAGPADAFQVSVRRRGGADTTVSLRALAVRDVEPKRRAWQADYRRVASVLPERIAYLRPGPFFDAEGGQVGYDGAAFATFLGTSFRQFIDAHAEDLVIDLRNNPGGDNSFSDPMVAWFADRPFRFASRYTLKASPETRRALAALAEAYPDLPAVKRLQAALRGASDGARVPFEVQEVQPRRDSAFAGRVWVLINRHTYSNATSVAALIQDYRFGTLLGEETSDLATSYGSAAQFTLPRTKIVVNYPKGYLVRPSGDTAPRGVVPDLCIATPIAHTQGDAVLEEAIRVVKERRAGSSRSEQSPRLGGTGPAASEAGQGCFAGAP